MEELSRALGLAPMVREPRRQRTQRPHGPLPILALWKRFIAMSSQPSTVNQESRVAGSWVSYVEADSDSLKVFIDCRHAIVRVALELALRELGFEGAPESSADIVIRDLRGSNGPRPSASVPTLALVDDMESAIRALRLGYLGYLAPDAPIEDLGRAARVIRRGEHWAERRVLVKALTEPKYDEDEAENRLGLLTRREHEVLGCVLRGLTNVGIARELGISPKTVKGHVSAIYGKLRVRNRKELLIALS